MAQLGIETRDERGLTLVALSGEFDLSAVQQFEGALRKLEPEAEVIVVDLTDLSFMDSSGLRALVMADQRAKAAGHRLAIVPGPPVVRRVFEITQLDDRLDLVDSVGSL